MKECMHAMLCRASHATPALHATLVVLHTCMHACPTVRQGSHMDVTCRNNLPIVIACRQARGSKGRAAPKTDGQICYKD